MINALQSELGINVIASIIVSALFLGIGFVWANTRNVGASLGEISKSTTSILLLSLAKTLARSA